MSRRKQGRPQQRKTQDSLEQENDLLVCGDCQTSFPLHDIVQFIRHKKQCCNKENVDNSDSASRKPDSSNSHDTSADNDDDDLDQDGVAMSKESKEEGDETAGDSDNDNEEEFEEVIGHSRLGDGDDKEANKREEKSARKEEKISSTSSSSRELRTPLRPRQVVDAESNTTHSEPSRFVCETCRCTYTSAWALLQHAQKEHGMKIYTSPNSSSNQQSSSCAPITSSISPINLMVASSARSAVDHRSASVGSAGSVSPYPMHAPNPFSSPFRLPLDSRLTHPTSLSPFPRPPNFDFDLIKDYRLRPQLIARSAAGLDHPSFTHSPFDHTRSHIPPVLESQYDFYSMRLKQLANTPVSQSKSPFSISNNPQTSNFTMKTNSSKSESPPADVSLASSPRRNINSTLSLPPKQKACEFCGKTFRFQSNLVVHRRSHTGEKPYKCPRCPHACTQQSKLKRHMKTHSSKPDGEMSPNELSFHKMEEENGDDADDDEHEDEEDAEEFEEEEDDFIEEEMNEEEREVLRRMRDIQEKEERTPEPGEICHDAKKIKLGISKEEKCEEHNMPSDLSIKPKPTESLLSEVMKNTGLNDILTYSEAYKAALAESQQNGRGEYKNSVDSTSNDSVLPSEVTNIKSQRSGVKRELESDTESDKEDLRKHPFIGETDLSKSMKRESLPTAASSLWPTSIETQPTSNIDHSAVSIYSHLHPSWFHADNPVRLYFPGYASHFSNVRDLNLNSENHNGLNLSHSLAPTSSALKSDSQSIPALIKPRLNSPPAYTPNFLGTSSTSSSPTGSVVVSSNGSSAVGPLTRKEHRRNDTCEYCGKIFKNCSNLTVHRRSHTGEKPYKCNLCCYACAQSSKLTRHMKTHGRQGKDVYTCKFCNMPFSVPSTLEKHMRKCVENRNARLLATDDGDLSSESNGELSRQSDSASGLQLKTDPSVILAPFPSHLEAPPTALGLVTLQGSLHSA